METKAEHTLLHGSRCGKGRVQRASVRDVLIQREDKMMLVRRCSDLTAPLHWEVIHTSTFSKGWTSLCATSCSQTDSCLLVGHIPVWLLHLTDCGVSTDSSGSDADSNLWGVGPKPAYRLHKGEHSYRLYKHTNTHTECSSLVFTDVTYQPLQLLACCWDRRTALWEHGW